MKNLWVILGFILIIFKVCPLKAETIIVIDKGEKTLEIRKEKKTIALYEIGLGLKSPLPKEKKGDFLTPEGVYRIVNIRPSKEYGYFLELNYPNVNDLALAYYKGEIDKEKFIQWMKILENYDIIRDSPFGNEIGIHGGGAFKLEKKNGNIYKNYYWTKGCIALNDKDLLELLKNVKSGEKVYIFNSQKNLYDILKKFVYPVKIKPMEIFEGELYIKLDEYSYLNFYLVEYFSGLRRLTIQKWVKGALKEKVESDERGSILDREKEEHFKKLLIENLENFLKPYRQLEL